MRGKMAISSRQLCRLLLIAAPALAGISLLQFERRSYGFDNACTCNGQPVPKGKQCCYTNPNDPNDDSGTLFDPNTQACCTCGCVYPLQYVSLIAIDEPTAQTTLEKAFDTVIKDSLSSPTMAP